MGDYKFAYLFYGLLFVAVWAILFVLRRDLRLHMIVYSVLTAPLGPASEAWYLRDYWQPQTITGTAIGVEDLIFSFTIGGIALALYPFARNKTLSKSDKAGPNPFFVGMFAAFLFASLFLGTLWLRINSVLTSASAFLLTAISIVALRRDLAAPAFWSGILGLVLFVAVYQVMQHVYPGLLDSWCTGCNPSGIRPLGWNIEEYFWDAAWSMLGSVLYPSVAGFGFHRLEAQSAIGG